jgi:coproporphyrinogen III oxidase
MMDKIQRIASLYSRLHKKICRSLECSFNQAPFRENRWNRENGSGSTCVIQNGTVIEKGGVNYSFVRGNFTPRLEELLSEKAHSYSATGISSVMHPVNPHIPIIHFNIRYFVLDNGSEWFGGGIDLTPHFVDVVEARAFHQTLKNTCDKYDAEYYPKFKEWADNYFFIPHRNETRGIGGIFFDRLRPGSKVSFERILEFTIELGNVYPRFYNDIIQKKSKMGFTDTERKWQQIRRGRYVEFNLIYDRGTKFGFESSRNTESILISLPANALWEYNHETEINSPESCTLQLLKKEIDWINFSI